MPLYFYELHEGATDLLTDALLVSEQEHQPEAFAAMVKEARARGRSRPSRRTPWSRPSRASWSAAHGFTYIGDEKLRASMSVGPDDEDTFLVEQSDEFRSMVGGARPGS